MSDIFIKIGAIDYNAADYTIPSDRILRDAWVVNENSNAIVVDMDKARDIWRNKIREARKEKFVELDAKFLKALETGANTSTIVLQKQALRDAPADTRIASASTPEELKLVQPAGLVIT